MSDDPIRRAVALQPIKEKKQGKETGRWLARLRGSNGKVRQVGVFKTKRLAEDAILEAVTEENDAIDQAGEQAISVRRPVPAEFPLAHFGIRENYPRAETMDRRTLTTAVERIRRMERHMPAGAREVTMPHLTTGDFRLAIDAMFKTDLSRTSIGYSLLATSLLLQRLHDFDPLVTDVCAEISIPKRPVPGHKPKKTRAFRAVDPAEIVAFTDYLAPERRFLPWLLALTGTRQAEFLALNAADRQHDAETCWVHQTAGDADEPRTGTKTRRHEPDRLARGRETLFPACVDELLPAPNADGFYVTRSEGKLCAKRNFMRDQWGDSSVSAKQRGPMTKYELHGGQRFTPNDLRHSFISWLHTAGISLEAISAWAGHSVAEELGLRSGIRFPPTSRTTRDYYLEVMEPERRRAIDALTFIFRNGRLPVISTSFE